jgi:hypothetical protein
MAILRRAMVEKWDGMLHKKMRYSGMTELAFVTRIFGVASRAAPDGRLSWVGCR